MFFANESVITRGLPQAADVSADGGVTDTLPRAAQVRVASGFDSRRTLHENARPFYEVVSVAWPCDPQWGLQSFTLAGPIPPRYKIIIAFLGCSISFGTFPAMQHTSRNGFLNGIPTDAVDIKCSTKRVELLLQTGEKFKTLTAEILRRVQTIEASRMLLLPTCSDCQLLLTKRVDASGACTVTKVAEKCVKSRTIVHDVWVLP
ncbi:hypothetical protein BD289DRAFT_156827 [Coniella lustricola]|uniref:Uncharacterized protein n=1 Tax=Coniella lustricola TaxID=2025994 RepID=A0A2T3AMK1_9PEZI|nr:hypothetical protein BD289DRAFT_156827 [Coniella lustricola]